MMRTILLTAAATIAALTTAPAFAATPVNGSSFAVGGGIAAPAGATSVLRFNFLNGADGSTAANGPRYNSTSEEAAAQRISFSADGNSGRFNTTGPSPFGPSPSYTFAQPNPGDFGFYGIGGDTANGGASFAKFMGTPANAAFSSISVFLGSINSFNVVELLYNGIDGVDTYNGTQLGATSNALPGVNNRVTFTATGGRTFSGVRFYNNAGQQGSLELDNLAFTAAVPEPATWAMMVLGFGAIGFGMRRRKSAKTTVQFA